MAHAKKIQREDKEEKEAKIANRPDRPATCRCILVQPARPKSTSDIEREAKRKASLAERASQRNACEVARVRAAQEKHREVLSHFPGSVEQALLLGQRSIFT